MKTGLLVWGDAAEKEEAKDIAKSRKRAICGPGHTAMGLRWIRDDMMGLQGLDPFSPLVYDPPSNTSFFFLSGKPVTPQIFLPPGVNVVVLNPSHFRATSRGVYEKQR